MEIQLNSVTQSCLTPCDPMDCSMPGFPVHHQLPKLAQTHVHWEGNGRPLQYSCLRTPWTVWKGKMEIGTSQNYCTPNKIMKEMKPSEEWMTTLCPLSPWHRNMSAKGWQVIESIADLSTTPPSPWQWEDVPRGWWFLQPSGGSC